MKRRISWQHDRPKPGRKKKKPWEPTRADIIWRVRKRNPGYFSREHTWFFKSVRYRWLVSKKELHVTYQLKEWLGVKGYHMRTAIYSFDNPEMRLHPLYD